MNRKGSVLIYVLVTGVVVAMIAAGLLQMTMMNYFAVDRLTQGSQKRKEAESLLNRAISSWAESEAGVCSTILGNPQVTCSGSPGTCDCMCPREAGARPQIKVTPSCAIEVVSSDSP